MTFAGGFTGKILRVNLTLRTHSTEPLPDRVAELLLGGRGLAAKYYYDEIGPAVDPLGQDNKIIFMTGPLTGVRLPSMTKFQLATKSPLTGIYLCSNSGGSFGPQLKKAGYDGLIIEGMADSWTVLHIQDSRIRYLDATSVMGTMSSPSQKAMKELAGDMNASAMSIGPAGEHCLKLAYINVDSRAFGRGGPGAVMGSKRLKGIVVHGTGQIPLADPERVKRWWETAAADLKTSRAVHKKYGTPQYVQPLNELGIVPTHNYTDGQFAGAGRVDGDTMLAEYTDHNTACYMCPIACGKMNVVKEGPFAGARARTEYESIIMLGPNCDVDDFGAIIKATELCDEYGMDTISTGHAVSLAMELFERGLITVRDTDGVEPRFGSGQAVVDMVVLIAEKRGIGALLSEGMRIVREKKPEWSPYITAVKGLGLAGYDPRGTIGMSLSYGTSVRGACHNVGGWTIRHELLTKEYDSHSPDGKAALVKSVQDNRAYIDSIGVCTMARSSMGFGDKPAGDVLESVTGFPFTSQLMKIGSRISTLEKLITTREGVRRKDDRLPERLCRDAVRTGPNAGRVVDPEVYERMLDDYYRERGWDSEGIPVPETVRALGLEELL